MRKASFYTIIILLLFASACHLQTSDVPFVLQNLPGNYYESSDSIIKSNQTVIDNHKIRSCYKQNILVIQSNQTYNWTNISCIPNFQESGTWQLLSNGQLAIDSVTYNIQFSNDADTLVISNRSTSTGSLQVRTYVKQ